MTSPASASPARANAQSGVTLVELSIVLTIIALLIGAAVTGASMMKAMELRSLMSEYQKFQVGVNTFKTKYNSLPGDYANAVALWGMAPTTAAPAASDTACAALTSTSPSEGSRTCNGNNSGTIDAGYEEYRAWQHLANAQMLDGNFTGVGATTTAGVGFQSGSNCPLSKLRDGCWRVFYQTSETADATTYTLFNGKYDVHLFSHWGGGTGLERYNPTLLPAEMAELDNKYDDGFPATGKIIAPHGGTAGAKPFDNCTSLPGATTETTATDSNAVYRTNTALRECQFFVKADF